ncbi:hypothetical protein ACI2IV_04150 [Psychrobacter faecalis]
MRVLLVLPNDQELKPKVLAIINNISQALEVELQSVKIKQRNDFVFDCDYGPLSGEEVVEAFECWNCIIKVEVHLVFKWGR